MRKSEVCTCYCAFLCSTAYVWRLNEPAFQYTGYTIQQKIDVMFYSFEIVNNEVRVLLPFTVRFMPETPLAVNTLFIPRMPNILVS